MRTPPPERATHSYLVSADRRKSVIVAARIRTSTDFFDSAAVLSWAAMSPKVAPAICEAIEGHRVLEFDYEGHHRIVNPYCHGFTRSGTETLRAVQVEGSSSSGRFGFGKLWTVAKIQGLRILERNFVPDDPDYNPNDMAMIEVHCRVERAASSEREPTSPGAQKRRKNP